MSDMPQTPETPHHHDSELETLRGFINDYGKPLVTAVLAVAILVTGFNILRSRRAARIERAAQELAMARSPMDLEAIVADYGKTPSAPLALLAAAKTHYDSGNFEVALGKYEEFLAGYGTHPLAPAAELGKVHCVEARGDSASLAAAAADFEAFAAKYPDSYLASLAIFGKARCRQASGDLAGAQQIYEDFIMNHPKSSWQSYAETQREQLDTAIKRARTRVTTPEAPVLDVPVPAAAPEAAVSAPVPVAPVEVLTPAEASAGAAAATSVPPAESEAVPTPAPAPEAGAADPAAGR